MHVHTLHDIQLELPEWLVGTAIDRKIQTGDYEGHEAHAARMRIKPGMRVLEVGAGLGYVSSTAASLAGAEHVVSVEANPNMLAPLKANLARNNVADVRVMHGAIVADSHDEETVNFRAGRLFWGGATLPEGAEHDEMVAVPALQIGALLQAIRPKFVMLDVEGGEADLFKTPWPRFVRFVVLELHPRKYGQAVIKEIVDCMSKSGLTYDPVTSRGRTLGFMRV